MTPVIKQNSFLIDTAEIEPNFDARASQMDALQEQFARQLQARKEQKLLNSLGEHLHMDTIPLEFLQGLAKQLTRTVDQQGNERIYLNGEHIITFGPLTITREGNVMTAHQAYGPVGL